LDNTGEPIVADETPAQFKIERALRSCETINTTKLADYVGDYLEKSEKELACMPGTPSQVMAAQFVLHVKSSVEDLAEKHQADTTLFDKVADVILRSPASRSRRR
jgi:hypothetical protein